MPDKAGYELRVTAAERLAGQGNYFGAFNLISLELMDAKDEINRLRSELIAARDEYQRALWDRDDEIERLKGDAR